jgi:glycosyltransferase involved in cell wall biosynthesis
MRVPERIAFDARYINDQYHGIGRYAFRLLQALAGPGPEGAPGWAGDCTWVVFRGQASNSRFDWGSLASRTNVELKDGPWPLYWPQEQFVWPFQLRRSRADLFYSPYFVAPVATSRPVVITVHDLIFDRYPAYMPHAWSRPYYRLLMAFSTRRARRIVAVSEATAADLARLYRVPPHKVSVVLEAPDPSLCLPASAAEQETLRRRLGITAPFLMSVGTRRPHKNQARLVRAFATVAGQIAHDLVFAGPADERFPDEARRTAEEAGLQDRIHFLGWVSEADLRTLYALADLVALPSLVEGFGLPALEAMACGTPVLAADTSSLPEVVGDAGVLVDPYDEGALAQALVQLLRDPGWRDRLSQAGRARAAEFSWRQTAGGVLQALEEAYR